MRKQMVAGGIGNVPFYAGDSMGDDTYTKIAGNTAFNSYYTVMSPNGLYLTNAMARHFSASFERTYHAKPGAFDAAAYAVGQVEMSAIRNAVVADSGQIPTRPQVGAHRSRTPRAWRRRSARSPSMTSVTYAIRISATTPSTRRERPSSFGSLSSSSTTTSERGLRLAQARRRPGCAGSISDVVLTQLGPSSHLSARAPAATRPGVVRGRGRSERRRLTTPGLIR